MIYVRDAAGTCEASRQSEVLALLFTTPPEIQRLADEKYALLKADQRHPSLHFKKVGRMWSVRVGIHYRAVAVQVDQDIIWFWIGHHSEDDKIITGRVR